MRRSRSHISNIIEVILIVLYIASVIVFGVYFFTINKSDSPGGSNDINVSKGSVKVDIIDPADGGSLVGEVLYFTKGDKDAALYFEPGATYVTIPFQVKNIGTLSIDYNISVSEGDPKEAEEFRKAFTFGITTEPEQKEDLEALPSHRGKLAPGECSEELYIIVTMNKTAGNEYQNKSYKGIGIVVNAIELADE